MEAKVPATVAMAADSRATSRVVYREFMIWLSRNSSAYHSRVKPFHTVRLLELLKENTMSTKMGA